VKWVSLSKFASLAESEFSWLADEYQFEVSERRQIGNRYSSIVLRNTTSHVRIGWEPQDFCYLPVDVGMLSTAEAHDRHVLGRKWPLWAIVVVRSGNEALVDGLENSTSSSASHVRAALERSSRALWRYGRDVLIGDFSGATLFDRTMINHFRKLKERYAPEHS